MMFQSPNSESICKEKLADLYQKFAHFHNKFMETKLVVEERKTACLERNNKNNDESPPLDEGSGPLP